MNALTRPYRVAVRPLHLESLDGYTSRLLARNQETPAHRLHLLRLARLTGAAGTDKALWAEIIKAKTGRQITPEVAVLNPAAHSNNSAVTLSIPGIRYLCTRCSQGATVFQIPHFTMNVCLKHNRWVGAGTTPETQHPITRDVASAERKFRKMRASNTLSSPQFDALHRCLEPLRKQMPSITPAEMDAALYPILIRLATVITSGRFSQELFDPVRSYDSAYRYLAKTVAPYLPNSQRKVTRLLWLTFRSTFLTIRETFDETAPTVPDDADFAIHPQVVATMTRPIGPHEPFVSFLGPTGDDRIDVRVNDRPDSYDKIRNICRQGHRLTKPLVRTLASTRVGTDNCPVCMHRELRGGVNDMGTTHPLLGHQLHPTKNGPITAQTIFASTHLKLVWKCDTDDRHVYEATASNRVASGSGCSVCLNRVIILGINDLTTLFPQISRDWHPVKNSHVSLETVAPGSNELVWWLCPEKHTYRMTVGKRTRGTGCHYCVKNYDNTRSLAVARPDLASEMHRTLNGPYTPNNVTIGSGKDIIWRCRNDHDYTQRPERRKAGYGCPICSGRKLETGVNDIETRYPEIATEWHPWKNGPIEPRDLIPGNRKFWWTCATSAHVYEQSVPHRVKTRGCPMCETGDRIAHNIAR